VVAVPRIAVLFDPHPLWLDAIESVLARVDITVVEKTTRLQHALEAVERHLPDVLVTEITTADGTDTTDAIRAARSMNPKLRVIVLSTQSEPRYIDLALGAGATAYVIKTAHREDVLTTIRQAFEHSVFFAASGHGAPQSAEAPSHADGARGAGDVGDLTKRELEILRLVAEGRSNAQVAKTLWVTEQTVKFHLSNIYRKLDVANRTEASRWAQTRGLLAAPSGGAD
jgi:DNA-binding NarL/FixJ family response regulator